MGDLGDLKIGTSKEQPTQTLTEFEGLSTNISRGRDTCLLLRRNSEGTSHVFMVHRARFKSRLGDYGNHHR